MVWAKERSLPWCVIGKIFKLYKKVLLTFLGGTIIDGQLIWTDGTPTDYSLWSGELRARDPSKNCVAIFRHLVFQETRYRLHAFRKLKSKCNAFKTLLTNWVPVTTSLSESRNRNVMIKFCFRCNVARKSVHQNWINMRTLNDSYSENQDFYVCKQSSVSTSGASQQKWILSPWGLHNLERIKTLVWAAAAAILNQKIRCNGKIIFDEFYFLLFIMVSRGGGKKLFLMKSDCLHGCHIKMINSFSFSDANDKVYSISVRGDVLGKCLSTILMQIKFNTVLF